MSRRLDLDRSRPLRVIVAGAGGMGRAWLAEIAAADEVRLAGLVDLDVDLARRQAAALGDPDLPVGDDLLEVAQRGSAQAVIDVTVPLAHHPITTAALFAGLPVLGEKPAASTLAETLSLVAAAEVTGELFMVSQSRRWNPQLFALRDLRLELGRVGSLTTEFFKAAHFPGFREEMAHPLLVDMAIHPFDSARFLLGSEPVSVYCEAHNPPWSWFRGAASATAVFTMDCGARYSFTGSWCAPGAETSWNGSWRLSAEHGTALWDGEHPPTVHRAAGEGAADGRHHRGRRGGIAWALREFVQALGTGQAPMGEVHENAISLAMVDAAVRSAQAGAPVLLADVLDAAHRAAIAAERRDDVRTTLAAWSSAGEVLGSWPSARTALSTAPSAPRRAERERTARPEGA